MTYEITVRKYLPCCTDMFFVNGIQADSDDFVEPDLDAELESEEEEEFVCKCCCVKGIPAKDAVLRKYGITENEYTIIQEALCSELFVGSCNLCS